MICLVDMNGYTSPGHLPIAYWIDYDPQTSLAHFGGYYCDTNPVFVGHEPTDAEIDALQDFAEWMIQE